MSTCKIEEELANIRLMLGDVIQKKFQLNPLQYKPMCGSSGGMKNGKRVRTRKFKRSGKSMKFKKGRKSRKYRKV